MCFNPTNDLEVMIIESCWYCWKFLFEPTEVTYRLWNLGLEEVRPKETLNIKVVGGFHKLSKESRNSEFWYQTKKLWRGKVGRIFKIWLRFGIDFKFLLVFKICFLMQYEYMMSCNMSALYVPHQREKVAKYIWCTCSRWRKRAQQTYLKELTRVSVPA
jgi:hypothetical protein